MAREDCSFPELPGGWKHMWHESSQKFLFWEGNGHAGSFRHPVTGLEYPTTQLAAIPPTQVGPTGVPFPPLPEGWIHGLTAGKRYYFREKTSSRATFRHPVTLEEYVEECATNPPQCAQEQPQRLQQQVHHDRRDRQQQAEQPEQWEQQEQQQQWRQQQQQQHGQRPWHLQGQQPQQQQQQQQQEQQRRQQQQEQQEQQAQQPQEVHIFAQQQHRQQTCDLGQAASLRQFLVPCEHALPVEEHVSPPVTALPPPAPEGQQHQQEQLVDEETSPPVTALPLQAPAEREEREEREERQQERQQERVQEREQELKQQLFASQQQQQVSDLRQASDLRQFLVPSERTVPLHEQRTALPLQAPKPAHQRRSHSAGATYRRSRAKARRLSVGGAGQTPPPANGGPAVPPPTGAPGGPRSSSLRETKLALQAKRQAAAERREAQQRRGPVPALGAPAVAVPASAPPESLCSPPPTAPPESTAPPPTDKSRHRLTRSTEAALPMAQGQAAYVNPTSYLHRCTYSATYPDPAPYLAHKSPARPPGPRRNPKFGLAGADETVTEWLDMTPPPLEDGPVESPAHGECATKYTYNLATKEWVRSDVRVRIDKHPFQQGTLRNVYHLKDLSKPAGPAQDYVAKFSRNEAEPITEYFLDCKMQATVAYLAKEWNALQRAKKAGRPVAYVEAVVLELHDRAGPGGRAVVCGAEPYLHGTFIKVLNNFGWVNPKASPELTAFAFSHWSHYYTRGSMLICDVQGVLQQEGMDWYTDPQVHSLPPKRPFGRSDMRERGIAKFFETHVCNAVCHALRLPRHAAAAAPPPSPARTPPVPKPQVPSTPGPRLPPGPARQLPDGEHAADDAHPRPRGYSALDSPITPTPPGLGLRSQTPPPTRGRSSVAAPAAGARPARSSSASAGARILRHANPPPRPHSAVLTPTSLLPVPSPLPMPTPFQAPLSTYQPPLPVPVTYVPGLPGHPRPCW